MTFYVENETEETFAEGEVSFSVEDTVEKVANAVLEMEGCPYEVQLNVLLTDNDDVVLILGILIYMMLQERKRGKKS